MLGYRATLESNPDKNSTSTKVNPRSSPPTIKISISVFHSSVFSFWFTLKIGCLSFAFTMANVLINNKEAVKKAMVKNMLSSPICPEEGCSISATPVKAEHTQESTLKTIQSFLFLNSGE